MRKLKECWRYEEKASRPEVALCPGLSFPASLPDKAPQSHVTISPLSPSLDNELLGNRDCVFFLSKFPAQCDPEEVLSN